MIIVCTGGRDHNNPDLVHYVLNMLRPHGIIVGDCPTGVDLFVREWCIAYKENINHNFPYTVIEADWDKLGLAAGPIRNRQMIDMITNRTDALLLAFKGNKGTANCVKQAKARNVIVLEAK